MVSPSNDFRVSRDESEESNLRQRHFLLCDQGARGVWQHRDGSHVRVQLDVATEDYRKHENLPSAGSGASDSENVDVTQIAASRQEKDRHSRSPSGLCPRGTAKVEPAREAARGRESSWPLVFPSRADVAEDLSDVRDIHNGKDVIRMFVTCVPAVLMGK